MKITIITVGKIKEKFYRDAIDEYAKRLSKYCKFEIKASEEDTLTQNLTSWVKENLQKDQIDADIEEASEELLYFLRTEKMKEMITQKFLNLDAAFLDSFIDDIYPEIFG